MRVLRGACVLFVLLHAFAAVPAAAAEVVLRPPTLVEVLDPFRAPDGPYGAGNRGIEYDTSPGDSIRAAGPGEVVFAGPVAGHLHLTIDHGRGLKSSYSFVRALLVERGDVVTAGEQVAVANTGFHFGTRVDGIYVDPASLFGIRVVEVELIEGASSAQPLSADTVSRSERLHYLEAQRPSRSDVGLLRRALDAGWDVIGDGIGHDLSSLVDPSDLVTALTQMTERFADSDCTPASAAIVAPAERRVALLIDGLNSSSAGPGTMATLDLGAHGYAEEDVVRFSYSGGIVTDPVHTWASSLATSSYGSADTYVGVERTASEIETVLAAIAAAQPGVPIDLYAHSLGGLAARHALAALDLAEVPVTVAVTFASPHQGTPSADVAQALAAGSLASIAEGIAGLVGADGLFGSETISDLATSGGVADQAGVGFPLGIHAVTIAARTDVVVPATTAWAPGARHVVLDEMPAISAHSDLVGSDDAAREVALALAGAAPACEGTFDRLFDWAVPAVIDRAEHGVAAALRTATLFDGPSGPDSPQPAAMVIDSVRAKPGRFGVPHECLTGRKSMAVISMKQLLEAGVHFGHQTRRWNPKMKRFIHGERSGIHIVDLHQTLNHLESSYVFIRDLVANGGTVLFIGTKKQAQDSIQSYAERCNMPYINERWLGGMLTNFQTISKRVGKMQDYRRMRDSGEFEAMPKKEALLIGRELVKLERNLGGIRDMKKLPDAVFVLDTKKEHIAVTEARKIGIPIVAVVDTNCDPDLVDYAIPGNDDAIRAGELMSRVISDAVLEGRFINSKRQGAEAVKRNALQEAEVAEQQVQARAAAAAEAAEREARVAAAKAAPAEEAAPAAEAAPAEEAAPVEDVAAAEAPVEETLPAAGDDGTPEA